MPHNKQEVTNKMNTINEPKEAFPYKPPTEKIKQQYKEIFELKESLKVPFPKLLFDKLLASFFLLLTLPVFLFFSVGELDRRNSC